MSEHSAQIGGNPADPARRGGQIGSGLVPDEVTEGQAQTQAASGQADEGLVEPGGVDAAPERDDTRP